MSATTPAVGSFAALFEASRNLSHDVAPRQIRLSLLEPHPGQPRQSIDQGHLEELAASIRAHGLLQPLIVRPHPQNIPGRYQIVAGERRFHACQLAGLDSVPVVIRHVDDTTARQIALIENLQREDISPLEEAQVLAQILNETGCSHRELGEKVGKSKTYIEQRVRLLRYPSDVQAALANPLTSFHPGHAKAVVQIGDAETRQLLIAEIQRQQLSVREAEHRVTRLRTRQLKTHRTRTTAATSVTLDNLAVVALLRPLLVSQATQVDTTALRKALQQDIRMLNAAPSDEN